MKMIKVTTAGEISEVNIPGHFEAMAKEIGAKCIERVHIKDDFVFANDFIMAINEEGLLADKPVCNPFATFLYSLEELPIMGDVLFLSEGMTNEGVDFCEPSEKNLRALTCTLMLMVTMFNAMGKAEAMHKRFDGKTGADYPPQIIEF